MTVFGVLLAVFGFFMRYMMNRRAFNRRNTAGIEEFKSFEQATGSKFLEGVGRLAGSALIVIGLLIALASYFSSN